jgi:hypothetical protein
MPAHDAYLLDDKTHEALTAGKVEGADAGGDPRREVRHSAAEAVLGGELGPCCEQLLALCDQVSRTGLYVVRPPGQLRNFDQPAW